MNFLPFHAFERVFDGHLFRFFFSLVAREILSNSEALKTDTAFFAKVFLFSPFPSVHQIFNLTKKLHKDYPDAKIPILQAVKVFLKVRDNINTGIGALPTYLRREPESLNSRQPATAFYLNLSQLLMREAAKQLKIEQEKKEAERRKVIWKLRIPSLKRAGVSSIL